MARHCSSKDFFRQMPNALLARYFNARGLLPDLDFGAMPEGKPEALFEAWAALSDEQRRAAEADFREIVAMCDRKGLLVIVDEARWQMEDQPDAPQAFIDTLSALDDHHARAMVAFLDHPERWRVDGQTLGDALAGLLGAGACHPVPGARIAFRLGVVVGAADKAEVEMVET